MPSPHTQYRQIKGGEALTPSLLLDYAPTYFIHRKIEGSSYIATSKLILIIIGFQKLYHGKCKLHIYIYMYRL